MNTQHLTSQPRINIQQLTPQQRMTVLQHLYQQAALEHAQSQQMPFVQDNQHTMTMGNNQTGAGVGWGGGDYDAGFSLGGYGVRGGFNTQQPSMGAEITQPNQLSQYLYHNFAPQRPDQQIPFVQDDQHTMTIGNNFTGAGMGYGNGDYGAGFSVGGYGMRGGFNTQQPSMGAEMTRPNQPSQYLYRRF